MCYTRISNAKDGRAAIRYVMNQKGHNGQAARNCFVTGLNLLPDKVIPFSRQMEKTWKRASSRVKVQIHRIVQSFSRDELDPGKPEDILKGHEIGVRTARELYGEDCEVIVATQTDGKGHLVHNHILVNNVTLNGCGLTNERTFHPHIRQKTDEIAKEFIDISTPEPIAEKESPAVRGMRTSNAETDTERYIWQDDLRKRIRDAAAMAKDMDDFYLQLHSKGVKGIAKKATKTQPDYILYELVDVSGFNSPDKVPRNLKSKSYKMGQDYMPEGICKTIRQKQLEKGDDGMDPMEKHKAKLAEMTPVSDLSVLQDPAKAAEAEDDWRADVRGVFCDYKGWTEALPLEPDEFWGKAVDVDALQMQVREEDDFELRFRLYQNDLRRAGVDIPPVYRMNDYGWIFIDHDELRRQVWEYIHKEYAPKHSSGGKDKNENPAGKDGRNTKSGVQASTKRLSEQTQSAENSAQNGRNTVKSQSYKTLSPEERASRAAAAAKIFEQVEEIEKKAQEQAEFEFES